MNRLTELASPSKNERSSNLRSSRTTTFLADDHSRIVSPVTLTKAHFLDAYSKGKWNLSNVPCPPCLENVGLMHPPECYNETTRRKAVETYNKAPQWSDKVQFKKMVNSALKEFSVVGASISLLSQTKQIVKYEHMLSISECPRKISIDSHAILSQGYFVLLDASKDWRTSNSPFVKGVPNIKFYAGVPIVTKTNQVIGIFAIFDPFSKADFSEESIKKLQQYSKRIMMILDAPLQKQNFSDDNLSLARKLGRATSRGQIMSVFEKDGSGSPYFQNHNFRFSKRDTKFDTGSNTQLWKDLFQSGSLKSAASLLATVVAEEYKVDFVYIMEIRIAEPFQIASEYFPQENKIEAENYRFANKLIRKEQDNDVMTRVIGSYGATTSNLKFENHIHYQSFVSEFGIYYESKSASRYNSGLVMPFYRHNSKLVRKNRIAKSDTKLKSAGNKKIDIYLRSGGYLIALFNENRTGFDEDEVSNIFNNTSVLRKIYITS